MKLSGKVAIVTGGSRGIGKATATLFAKNGADVIITSKDKMSLEKTSRELNVLAITGDIRKETDVQNIVKKTLKNFGRIDILVNNAGIFPKVKPLHEISEDEWNEVIDVNLTGQFRFTKAAIPHMMKNGGGSIINISSDAGLKAFENFEADAYTASKAALVLLTKAWAIEYAKYKIRVNCVCPGIVETDMTKPYLRNKVERTMAISEHPIGRIGVPEDVAKAILYLVSDDSSWVTGAILPVDGGAIIK